MTEDGKDLNAVPNASDGSWMKQKTGRKPDVLHIAPGDGGPGRRRIALPRGQVGRHPLLRPLAAASFPGTAAGIPGK